MANLNRNLTRREAVASIAAASLAVPLTGSAAPTGGSKKKGWAGGNTEYHKEFGAHWYYTWSPKTRPSKAIEFVPMIKGAWSLKQAPAIRSMDGIKALLGFNEPERAKQGNLSIEAALKLWPQLVELAEAKGLQLGSPAPSSDGKGMAWFEEFMEQAKRRKLRIDFVAMHWYRSRDARAFESFVKGLEREHRLPIWITEFNGWSGTERENYDFLKDSLRFLERSKSVQRYAYFNPQKGKPHSLLKEDGSLSRMGELYRDA